MKTRQEIYAQMCALYTQKTGVEAEKTCDVAVRLMAVAAQIEGLYLQSEWVKAQCFPHTAQGEHLDYHASLRNLQRKQGTKARGVVRFHSEYTQDTDRVIAAGTVVMTKGLCRFETTQAATILAGETMTDAPAQAILSGTQGNVAAREIALFAAIEGGVCTCENLKPFTGGTDAEGDESLRARVLASYSRLPNGANVAYYEKGALAFPEVAAVQVIGRARGIGTVDIVIASHDGVASDALLKTVQDYFESQREIAVDVKVIAPQVVPCTVEIALRCQLGTDEQAVAQQVKARIAQQFTGENLGKHVRVVQLGNVIFSCDGVENYQILSPNADVVVEKNQIAVLEDIKVGMME